MNFSKIDHNIHTCPRCGYQTPHLSNIYAHFDRKYPCKPKISNIPFDKVYQIYNQQKCTSMETLEKKTEKKPEKKSEEKPDEEKPEEKLEKKPKKKYNCKYCPKSYAHSQSLYKHCINHHQNTTNVSIESVSRDEYETLKSELDTLKNKVSTQLSSPTITNNTTYNNNQIFIINSFGNEKIDYINDDFVKNSLKQPKKAINNIIRQIHFNPGRPQNHNVKITNKKLPYISVFTEINFLMYSFFGVASCFVFGYIFSLIFAKKSS